MVRVRQKSVLIVKLGYSETLDNKQSLTTNLGDVLRTTFILHYFKDRIAYWLTDKKAYPLLHGNKYLKEILFYKDRGLLRKLKNKDIDTIVNFEKSPEVCLLLQEIPARVRMGFCHHDGLTDRQFCAGEKDLLEISQDIRKRKKIMGYWQYFLARAVGRKWKGEEYILGYKPQSEIIYDIGFNWTTSNKWKNKCWPKKHWVELEGLVGGEYRISWQKGFNNLYKYIEWINSCRLIITADTLGLHLALALRKKVIALFGPTSPDEIFLYGRGSYILPDLKNKCIPCYMPECNKKKKCMDYIFPEKVKERIEDELKRSKTSRPL